MNPWRILGWVVLGCVLLLVFLLLSLWGLWQDWATRSAFFFTLALVGLPLLLAGIWLLLRRAATRQIQAEHALPAQAVFRATEQGQTLQHRWNEMLAEAVPRPLFLVLGCSYANLRTLVAEALPLSMEIPAFCTEAHDISLRISHKAAWLMVSPRLSGLADLAGQTESPLDWTPKSDGTGWEVLLEMLPTFPGAIAGAVVALAPNALNTKSENLSSHMADCLAHCLGSLRARLGRPLPVWLLLDRLDQLPGGRGFCKDCTFALSENQRPLGVTLEAVDTTEANEITRLHILGNHVDQLGAALQLLLEPYDTALLRHPPLARHTTLLAHALQSCKTALCLCGEKVSQGGMSLAGFFLCGGAGAEGSGRIFVRELFECAIPEDARRFLRMFPPKRRLFSWALFAPLTLLLCVGLAAILCIGTWQTSKILDALEQLVLLQQRSTAEQTVPLPRLLETAHVLKDQTTRMQGAAHLFSAARTAVCEGQTALRAMVLPLLPAHKDDAHVLSLWTGALTNWSAQQPEVTPLLFRSTGEVLTKVEGWASAAGRQKVVDLLWELRESLPQVEQSRLNWILDAYDVRMFAAWRDSALTLLAVQQAACQEMAHTNLYSETKMQSLPAGALEGWDSHTVMRLPVATRPVAQIQMQEALSGTSPIVRFIDAAARELAFSRQLAHTPPWILALCGLGEVRVLALQGANTSTSDIFTQNLKDRGRSLASLLNEESFVTRKPHSLDTLLQAAADWRDWQDSLHALLPQALSRQGLTALLAEFFSGASGTPLAGAEISYRQLQTQLVALSPVFAEEDAALAHALLESPLRLVRCRGMAAVTQQVQASWKHLVLDPLRASSPAETWSALFDEEGLLQKFLDSAAAPYLHRSPKGFKPATAFGMTFPFTPQFIRFLNGGNSVAPAHPKKYPLTLHLLPVTVNADALSYPRGATVRLFCEGPPLEASALNNKKSLSFNWTPESCNGAELEIHFDDFSLTLEYLGRDGVQKFLSEAARGGTPFTAEDFPDFKAFLNGAGVSRVYPRFRLQGGEAFLSFMEDTGAAVPSRIIQQFTQEAPAWR